jgi:two-component system NarL family response regulator
MSPGPIRVLIVDDHPMVRAGLVAIVARESDMVVAGEAGNGEVAIHQFSRLDPDVVLMDLGLPGIDGSDAIRKIRESHPGARLLAMSSFAGDEDIHKALRSGARGYLMKGAEPGEILSAIRTLRAGLKYIPPAVAETLGKRDSRDALTSREIETLEAVAHGLSNREIALQLYVSESTIKARIKQILSKLRVPDRTAAVTSALRRGIIHL